MGIKKKIILIIEQIDNFPVVDKINIYELLEHDEWGVALESLCGALDEERISISNSVYEAIKSVGNEMEMDSGIWDNLKHLIRKC